MSTHIALPPDTLEAFRRDVVKLRYADWGELMDYCRYSAMPVGRFVLDVNAPFHAHYIARAKLGREQFSDDADERGMKVIPLLPLDERVYAWKGRRHRSLHFSIPATPSPAFPT